MWISSAMDSYCQKQRIGGNADEWICRAKDQKKSQKIDIQRVPCHSPYFPDSIRDRDDLEDALIFNFWKSVSPI